MPELALQLMELGRCSSVECCYALSCRAAGREKEVWRWGGREADDKQQAGVRRGSHYAGVRGIGRQYSWYTWLAQNTLNNTMGISSCVRRRPVASCLLLFTFATTIFAATDDSSEKNSRSETTHSGATELKTEVLYAPDVCNTKSKNGDMLTMHYKGTLQDGTTFDSRYDKVFSNENIIT